MAATKQITVIIPVFNEAENLASLYLELQRATQPLPYQFEFLFVDDGSRDDSVGQIHQLAKADKHVHLIELTRNFGKEIATTAGLHAAKGQAAILIDADLQHPPQLIPDFIARWEQGSVLVVGVRQSDRELGLVRNLSSKSYYRILSAISATVITPHATDYRLLDRVVIDEFNRFTERNRLSRGLVDWLGFERDYLYFTAGRRTKGQSYGRIELIRLAVNSFVSHSMLPLRLAGYLGLIITFISGLSGAFIVVEQYFLGDPLGLHFSGTAQLAVILVFLVGIILICLGLIALYIANIHDEVMNRPIYVVRRRR